MLRKPILGKILGLLQIVTGGYLLGVSAYLLFLTRTPKIRLDSNAQSIIPGLYAAAAILVLPGILFTIAGVAMLRRRRWSWWFGLVVCLAAVATLGQDLWGHRHPEMEDLTMFAAFAFATIFFFLPGVRNYLVTNNAVAIQASSTETP